MTSLQDEDGSATILMLAIAAITICMFSAIGIGFAIAYQYRTVQNAGDLSALAAADYVITDPANACNVAKVIAERNGADLVECDPSAESVEVRVQSQKIHWVMASSKAGIF